MTQQVTFRLADSLPTEVWARWDAESTLVPEAARRATREQYIEKSLDQGRGDCHLGIARVARMVEQTLLFFDGQRYKMLTWCVMPNHVHTVVHVLNGFRLEGILHSWKSYSAKEANRILRRTGSFWQPEYHDRLIRDEAHLLRSLEYVEFNPVAAGLVEAPEDWSWSSARHRMDKR